MGDTNNVWKTNGEQQLSGVFLKHLLLLILSLFSPIKRFSKVKTLLLGHLETSIRDV